jgi:hypothetical protein
VRALEATGSRTLPQLEHTDKSITRSAVADQELEAEGANQELIQRIKAA